MKVNNKIKVYFSTTLELTEKEMRALDALTGYGFQPFIKVFYEHMGEHYMKPYEQDLREIFAKVRTQIVPGLNAIDQAREALEI